MSYVELALRSALFCCGVVVRSSGVHLGRVALACLLQARSSCELERVITSASLGFRLALPLTFASVDVLLRCVSFGVLEF